MSFKKGFIKTFPVAFTVFAYGTVLGVLASGKKLTYLEIIFMDTAMFAGTAQFAVVEMWSRPFAYFEIVTAVFIMNLRYLLIGASLRPVFAKSGIIHRVTMMHLVADENWAVTMKEFKFSNVTPLFLFGGGVCVLVNWTAGTLIGFFAGEAFHISQTSVLDFIVTAVFLSLAASLYENKKDILPLLIAAFTAWLSSRYLPGKWYILIGAIAGSTSAAFSYTEENRNES